MKYFNREKVDVRGSLSHGSGCSIDINVIFEGKVLLGDNVTIGSNCIIKDSVIGNNTFIKPFTYIEESLINEQCNIGPYANLRKGSKIGSNTSDIDVTIGKLSDLVDDDEDELPMDTQETATEEEEPQMGLMARR